MGFLKLVKMLKMLSMFVLVVMIGYGFGDVELRRRHASVFDNDITKGEVPMYVPKELKVGGDGGHKELGELGKLRDLDEVKELERLTDGEILDIGRRGGVAITPSGNFSLSSGNRSGNSEIDEHSAL